VEVMILITPTHIVLSLDLFIFFSIAAFELGHLTVLHRLQEFIELNHMTPLS